MSLDSIFNSIDNHIDNDNSIVLESDASELSFEDIQKELNELIEKANKGLPFCEQRLDELIELQNKHPEYLIYINSERDKWIATNKDFFEVLTHVYYIKSLFDLFIFFLN